MQQNLNVSTELKIRDGGPGDAAAIEALYPQAFPEEDLVPLVQDLGREPAIALSLVGTIETELVGHVIFTTCGVTDSDVKAALLAPLAVAPEWQRQGIGTLLVRAGLERVSETGVRLVCVLGDPRYYGRLGFATESQVAPPYRLPAEWTEAWQSQYLDSAAVPCAGALIVPPQWQDPALWAP